MEDTVNALQSFLMFHIDTVIAFVVVFQCTTAHNVFTWWGRNLVNIMLLYFVILVIKKMKKVVILLQLETRRMLFFIRCSTKLFGSGAEYILFYSFSCTT